MNKRYQVFVSSTYEDLKEERLEVIQALLELDCIPSGMELFPATDDDQWTLIKKVIDDCDYYVVIVAGRYGSTDESGKSYTQLEYEYALKTHKPVIGFVHEQPEQITAGKTETSEEGRKKLTAFRELVQKKTVRKYSTSKELGSLVSRSLVKLMKSHPSPGWIKATEAALSDAAALDILRLRNENENLRTELRQLSAPQDSGSLAHGDETYYINFDIEYTNKEGEGMTWSKQVKRSWDSIAKLILPLADPWSVERDIKRTLEDACFSAVLSLVQRTDKDIGNLRLNLTKESQRTILIQLQALGYIKQVTKDSPVKWGLTPYGEITLVRLYALRTAQEAETDPNLEKNGTTDLPHRRKK